MCKNIFTPRIVLFIVQKMYCGGLGAEPPAKKMEFLVGENLQSYTKIYIEQCKMGIKKSKSFLNKGGGFYLNFFQNLKNVLIKEGGFY